MDPLILAAIAAPFLAKGADAFSKSAGDKLGAKVGELEKGGSSRMAFDQRGQTVHGSLTNIAGNVSGMFSSGRSAGR